MNRTIKIQIFEGDKLVREIAEDNTIVIVEGETIIALGNCSFTAALEVVVTTDEVYNNMRQIIMRYYHLSEEDLLQHLAFFKLSTRPIKTVKRGDDK